MAILSESLDSPVRILAKSSSTPLEFQPKCIYEGDPTWQFFMKALTPPPRDFRKIFSYPIPWIFNLCASPNPYGFQNIYFVDSNRIPGFKRCIFWIGFEKIIIQKGWMMAYIRGSQPFGTCVPPNQSCNPLRTPKSNLYLFAYPTSRLYPFAYPPTLRLYP